jgi:hypothetical protein
MIFPSHLSRLLNWFIFGFLDYSSLFFSFWPFCLLYPIDAIYHA